MARLYSDEDFSYPVVEELRRLGHDVLTAQEAGQGNLGVTDSAVLAFSIAIVVWSGAAMAHAFCRTMLQFSIARFFLGVGEAANWPASDVGRSPTNEARSANEAGTAVKSWTPAIEAAAEPWASADK